MIGFPLSGWHFCAIKMADPTEDDQQRANIFYCHLGDLILHGELESMKAGFITSNVIPTADLEKCDTFSKLCRRLTCKTIISPKRNGYLMRMFKTFGREDLSRMVQTFDKEQNQISDDPIPITHLYNLGQDLPIEERLHEIYNVLEKFLHEPSNVIPQQLFYTNAAAGIARPDGDISLELGKDVKVNIPKGAVTEKDIIYCHFVDGVKPCLLENGQRLVCYSIPVFLGPAKKEFKGNRPVILVIAHNIACKKRSATSSVRFFVKRDGKELIWREGGEHFCMIEEDKRAIIYLEHFSEFVIGVDPSTTTLLPPMRARLITSCREVGETERTLIICLVFDSAFMIKKAKQLLRKKEGSVLGVVTSQEIILEPRVSCKIKVEGRRWKAKDQVKDVTLDELDMLVFNPISREITMVQEEKTDIQDSRLCNIFIMQNTETQEFSVSDDTFKLSKPGEDEVSTPAYTEARPEYVEGEKGLVTDPTIVNSLLGELICQRTKFTEYIDKMHEQTKSVIDVMHMSLQQFTTEHQKQAENYQEQIDILKKDHQQQRMDNQEQKKVYEKHIEELQKSQKQQKEDHQKQINASNVSRKQQRSDLMKYVETISKSHKAQIDLFNRQVENIWNSVMILPTNLAIRSNTDERSGANHGLSKKDFELD